MTAREMATSIGACVYLEAAPGLRVLCQITNAKTSYGHTRLEIEPLAGTGRAWVSAGRLSRPDSQTAQQEGKQDGRC